MIKRTLLRIVQLAIEAWRTIDRGMRCKMMLRSHSPFRCSNFTYHRLTDRRKP